MAWGLDPSMAMIRCRLCKHKQEGKNGDTFHIEQMSFMQ